MSYNNTLGSSSPRPSSSMRADSKRMTMTHDHATAPVMEALDVLTVLPVDGDVFRALRYLPIKTVERVSKMNRVGRRQDRLLIVTDSHIFSAIPAGGDVQRCIFLDSITECRVNRTRMEMACIIPSEYNFLIQFYEAAAMTRTIQCFKATTRIVEEAGAMDFHALHIDKPENFNRAPLPIATLAFPAWHQKATMEQLMAANSTNNTNSEGDPSMESSFNSLRLNRTSTAAGVSGGRRLRTDSELAAGGGSAGLADALRRGHAKDDADIKEGGEAGGGRWKSLPAVHVPSAEEKAEELEAHLGPSPSRDQRQQPGAAVSSLLAPNSLRLDSRPQTNQTLSSDAAPMQFRTAVVRDLSNFEVDRMATTDPGAHRSSNFGRQAVDVTSPAARGNALLRNVAIAASSNRSKPNWETYDEDDDVPPPPPPPEHSTDSDGSPLVKSSVGGGEYDPSPSGSMPVRRKDGTLNVEVIAEKSELVRELRRQLGAEERKNAMLMSDMAELLAAKREGEVSMQQEMDALRSEMERMTKDILRFRRPWALDL